MLWLQRTPFLFTFLLLVLVLSGSYSDNAHALTVSESCNAMAVGQWAKLDTGNWYKKEANYNTCYGGSPYVGVAAHCQNGIDDPWPGVCLMDTVSATCPDGSQPVNGLCALPPPPCPASGTAAIPSGMIGYGETAEGTNPATGVLCNQNQCAIKINQGTAIPIGGGLQGVYVSNATYTGERLTGTCPLIVTAPSPKDTSLPKPIDTVTPPANTANGTPTSQQDCPAGSAFGQVNGVNVCAPPGTKTSYVPQGYSQDNNGSVSTGEVAKTQTVNPDGSISTTTTSSTTGTSGTVTSSSTTHSNPGTSLGENSSQGEGVTGVDLGPAPAAESGEAPTIPGIAPGTGADGEGGAAKTFSVGNHFAGNNSCIADRSITALGITITVPLSQLCPWFDVMYKVVSLFAVFAAFRILVMA